MTELIALERITPADADLVGGKALGLARLLAAGLPVPPAFCLTAAAHARLRDDGLRGDVALLHDIARAFEALGGGPVAVRSSATAEDGAVASFAGQQATVLGVRQLDELHAAIARCWASLDAEGAVAYRRQHGLGPMGMAVVVQRLVEADAAGVLFTRDPLSPDRRMLVEASWGLGESVVSGLVTPDRFSLDWQSGTVLDRQLAVKTIERTSHGERAVPADRQAAACLSDAQLAALAELGRRCEELFGEPRDIEWALAGGQLWLLQARPITAGPRGEREAVRLEEIAALRARAAPGGTAWARFNLAEVLPEPTPMSWAVARRLMAGTGGFGLMYRDLGYDPDPGLDADGIFDLVCGRPYCNLSREPLLHYRGVPFEHSFAALKADPRRALYPSPRINPARLRWPFWLFLPIALPRLALRLMRGALTRQRLLGPFAARFRDAILPAWREQTAQAVRLDLTRLHEADVLRFFDRWLTRTVIDFARDSLKPTALAALALARLEGRLRQIMTPPAAQQLVGKLVMGVRPEPEADLAGGVRDLAAGRLTREAFLGRFGHRGGEEMELSRPRWAEAPAGLPAAGEAAGPAEAPPSPAEVLAGQARLSPAQRELILEEVAVLHTYLALRESGKHHLMLGYALLRKALVELDRRHGLEGGVFYLTPEELPVLAGGEDFAAAIAARRKRRALALGLEVPAVLFSDDLEAIGRPAAAAGGEALLGVGLSAGVAEGPARVLLRPEVGEMPAEGYVLVCPSTDPAWVPLFVRARALVMETGGVLSHGAIVARELGLPAVAGLPGVTRLIRDGQRLRVDGGEGRVVVCAAVPG